MDEHDLLAERFEGHRARLRGVAYRMLGSTGEADDAVQEAWLRLSRSGAGGIENLGGWLTTVVARVCLNMLTSRRSRREEPLEGPLGEPLRARVPDPIVGRADGADPEHEALLADGVGLALLVVLETLTPAERLAFVLHDTFGMPFAEIAAIVGRSPTAARQLASRARRRVRGASPAAETDPARQREVVDAFLAASRGGDFEALLAVLDPNVVLRADYGAAGASRLVRGARAVAGQALTYSRLAPFSRPALVNGAPGTVTAPRGVPRAVMGFTVAGGRIVEIDILADPERLSRLDLSAVLGG
jgi:RNA polymerase sigma factor (sigma-70 family)